MKTLEEFVQQVVIYGCPVIWTFIGSKAKEGAYFSRMRVDLAAQVSVSISLQLIFIHFFVTNVLGKSVADAISHFGDVETSETESFVRYFDRLFDCFNVRSLSEWRMRKKPDLKLYTSVALSLPK